MAEQVPARNGGTLKRLEKGDPTNPGAGRPKGSVSLTTILDKILSGKIKIQQGGEEVEITKLEALALGLVRDALQDEDPNIRHRALDRIADRLYGKPKQEIEQSGKFSIGFDFEELTPDQAEKILETIRGK
jgi:hypothetical protein